MLANMWPVLLDMTAVMVSLVQVGGGGLAACVATGGRALVRRSPLGASSKMCPTKSFALCLPAAAY